MVADANQRVHAYSDDPLGDVPTGAGRPVPNTPSDSEWEPEEQLEKQASEWSDDPDSRRNGHRPPVAVQEPGDDVLVHSSLHPVDLGPVLDGTATQPVPTLLHRDDGQALLYPGSINAIHGGSGDGKGWVVCHAIVQNVLRCRRTLLIDFEDTAESIMSRLVALGLKSDQILTWVIYIRPQVPLGPTAVDYLAQLTVDRNVELVVVDSLGEAFALEGVDENKDSEVGPWFRRVARPLAETGAAVLLVDHATKAADNPLHPSGSKRKRAAIGGASYLVEAVRPFVKGEGGRLRLTCAKDRHGVYRRGETVADLVMNSTGDEVHLSLYAPTVAPDGSGDVKVELAARAAIAAVKAEGRPVSKKSLEGLMKVKASNDTKRGGIELALSRGCLAEEAGPHNARLFRYVRDEVKAP